MASARKKKTARTRSAGKASPRPSLDPLRRGMPALDSITGVDEFRKGKSVLRIIHTKEMDEYEQGQPKVKRKKH